MRFPRRLHLMCLLLASSVGATSNTWTPPGVGTDGYDWIQLSSGEWLRGWLQYVQDDAVEFDSDELDELTLDLEKVPRIYPAKAMYVKFEGRSSLYGSVVVSSDSVTVQGTESLQLPLSELIGITPGGRKSGMRHWSGKCSIGINQRSGNTKSSEFNVSAEMARRTPSSDMELEYLGNVSEIDGVESENNQRLTTLWDLRLNRRFFLRPVLTEYFHDPLANISGRFTGGFGLGYYLIDRHDVEWNVFIGPAYQHTKFDTVNPGDAETSSAPSAVLQSTLTADVTKDVDLSLTYRGIGTSEEAGLYTHHAVVELEYEIKRHLDLDLSYVWDYIQEPQAESESDTPEKSDLRLIVSLGLRF